MTSGWANSNRRSELPDDWPQRKAAVFKRDGHRCQARRPDGSRCGAPATDCDHMGDPHDHRLERLQAVCHPCHVVLTVARRPASRRLRPPEPHPGRVTGVTGVGYDPL